MATRASIGQRILNYPFTDSLLTSVAYMNPRYDGCKLVSSQKNTFTEGDVSYGKEANVEEKTNTIYEFDWGGGAYPEVEKGGAVHLTKIIALDKYDEDNSGVYITRPSDTDYNQWGNSLNRTLNIRDNINLEQYESNVNILPNKNLVVIEPGLGIPTFSANQGDISGSYWLPINGAAEGYGFLRFNSTHITENNPYPYIITGPNVGLPNVVTNTNFRKLNVNSFGNYQTSSLTTPPVDIVNELNEGISQGDRYFISVYVNDDEFLEEIQGQSLNQIGLPLEVIYAKMDGVDARIYLKGEVSDLNEEFPSFVPTIGLNINILLWKARKGDFVTIQPSQGDFGSDNYSGLKKGAFYREFSQDVIKQKFKPITQYFGENPQT
jgi:hypothetical protein